MKFKTTIEIVSEAKDRNEAFEIAGEYLSGYLASGVEMKCSTKGIPNYNKGLVTIVIASLILTASILSLVHIKPSKNFIRTIPGINAIQAPLKTSGDAAKDDFKKEWETRQTKEALNHIKK